MPRAIQIPGIGLAAVALVRWIGFQHCHDASTLQNILSNLGQGDEAWLELLDAVARAEHPRAILVLAGEGEPPFYGVARGIHERISASSSKSEFHSFPGADHMDWCHHWDQEVGSFFRGHISRFLAM